MPEKGDFGISRRELTKECPICGAEMERSEALTRRAVDDREEDSFSSIWTCANGDHKPYFAN
jgi:hypothetical protein